jgi:DNA invertase Pin-like site-specific DNA recombinase
MMAEISLERVGAVFSLDASRLARNSSDWHQLLKVCALTSTLVIDEHGVHDPNVFQDHMLLGMKGSISDYERHMIMNRLVGGRLRKAQNGELKIGLPAGFVWSAAGKIVFDPDEEVRKAVHLIFSVFSEKGSAFAVVRYFKDNGLEFPHKIRDKIRRGEIVWRKLNNEYALKILHSPFYAGCYVYGRTKKVTRLLPGEVLNTIKTKHRVLRKDWKVLKHDSHEGYITWNQFLQNEHQMEKNSFKKQGVAIGVARKGSALLQGIILCGICGRSMNVQYWDHRPAYCCNKAQLEYAADGCQSVAGAGIEKAVEELLLDSIRPAQLEMSLGALDQIESQMRQVNEQWRLRQERANDGVKLARRFFDNADPDNRRVTLLLEKALEEKLAEVESLERERLCVPTAVPQRLTSDERESILSLAHDLPAIWTATTTTFLERKGLLRLLIKNVTVLKDVEEVKITVHWQTGASSELRTQLPTSGTNPQALKAIRDLASTLTDRKIAEHLNEMGFVPKHSHSFTSDIIRGLRFLHSIPGCLELYPNSFSGQRADGRYSVRAVADAAGVNRTTVLYWCKIGRFDTIRSKPTSPHWILLTPQQLAELKPLRRQKRPNLHAK